VRGPTKRRGKGAALVGEDVAVVELGSEHGVRGEPSVPAQAAEAAQLELQRGPVREDAVEAALGAVRGTTRRAPVAGKVLEAGGVQAKGEPLGQRVHIEVAQDEAGDGA
jgi:hypothetical protein